MPNFFEDAALAMLDPTSVHGSSAHRASFHSFSSLSDMDCSALGLKGSRGAFRPTETDSPELGNGEDESARWGVFDEGAHIDMMGLLGGLYADGNGLSTPSDVLSLSPNLAQGSTSPSSTYSASRPAATVTQHSLAPALSSLSANDDPFAFDASLFSTPYAQPGLSSKTSVESFASSAASDILRTPRQSWSHPWDELSMPSGHAIPGESPMQAAYNRAGSPRRDRVLSAKHSMPALAEEDDQQGMSIAQGLNTLPSYPEQPQQDDVFFFAPPPTAQQAMPLLPAASVNEPGSYGAPAQSFQAQSQYDQAAMQYQNGQNWSHPQTSPVQMGYGQDGRPLTAPDSNASSSGDVPPSYASSAMRKTRSIDPRARKVSHPQPVGDLFTFKEREIPSRLDGSPNGFSKSARFTKGSHKREASELFATQPIDVSRGELSRPLSIKVSPPKQPYSQEYYQPQGGFPGSTMLPITPDEQAFPVQSVHPSVLQPHSFSYGSIDDNVVLPVTYYTPPRTGRTNSTDSLASSNDERTYGPTVHCPAPWQQQLGGFPPSLGVSQPMQQTMSLPVSSGMRSHSLSGWDMPTVSDFQAVPATANPAGLSARPMAPLPSPRKRVASEKQPTTPKSRKASGKKAKAAGGFSCSFINFTQDDAEKLLTGVAPSGSAKRRRDVSGSSDDGDESPKRAKA